MKCPGCTTNVDDYKRDPMKALQHHFWGGHKLDVIRSHELARKAVDKKLSESELAELKQQPLPLGT